MWSYAYTVIVYLTILLCSTIGITFSTIWVLNFDLADCPQDEISFTYQL